MQEPRVRRRWVTSLVAAVAIAAIGLLTWFVVARAFIGDPPPAYAPTTDAQGPTR
jgi:hypothetical protein